MNGSCKFMLPGPFTIGNPRQSAFLQARQIVARRLNTRSVACSFFGSFEIWMIASFWIVAIRDNIDREDGHAPQSCRDFLNDADNFFKEQEPGDGWRRSRVQSLTPEDVMVARNC